MIFRAAWSCFLVRKEPLAEGRKDEENSPNTQASPVLSPLGPSQGRARAEGRAGSWGSKGRGHGGGGQARRLGPGPYLLRGGRLPVGRRR